MTLSKEIICFNLPSNIFCFYFSISKLNFNSKFCVVIVHITMYVKEYIMSLFVIIFHITSYMKEYFIIKYSTHRNNNYYYVIFFNMLYDVFYNLTKFAHNTTLVPGEIQKCIRGQIKLSDIVYGVK